MKKITSILLAVSMILSLCVLLAACGHEHEYATAWSKDATHHWHACTGKDCAEIADKAEHTWNEGEITTVATKEAKGVKTFTCTACAQTKTEAVDYVPATTVSAENWASAFELGENYTATVVATHPTQGSMSMITKRDGDKFHNLQTITSPTNQVMTSEKYNEIESDVWYSYSFNTETQKYVKNSSEDPVEDCVAQLIEQYLPQAIITLNAYAYNETTKTYDAASIAYGPMTLTNLSLGFEDGKVVSFSYSVDVEGATVVYTTTFTYGGASVTLPAVD